MFDFEKLNVYQEAKEINKEALSFLRKTSDIDSYIKNQWRSASISSVINIAEGSGKFSKADKRNFYTISRGSVYESVSLIDLIHEEGQMKDEQYQYFYNRYEKLSKMLLGLINSQK